MTEFPAKSPEEVAKEYWAAILGPLEPKEYYRKDLQAQPGLITIRIEGEELCPITQFQPEKSTLELYPKLAEGWALARKTYGHKDPDGLITATIFATPVPQFQGSSILDVLATDSAEEIWDQARGLIILGFPQS